MNGSGLGRPGAQNEYFSIKLSSAMNRSGLGRPGAQNDYFRNKASIRNERILAHAAGGPKSIFFENKKNFKPK